MNLQHADGEEKEESRRLRVGLKEMLSCPRKAPKLIGKSGSS